VHHKCSVKLLQSVTSHVSRDGLQNLPENFYVHRNIRKLTVIWMICQPLLFLDLMLWWSLWDLDICMSFLFAFPKQQFPNLQTPCLFYLNGFLLYISHFIAFQLQFFPPQHLQFSSPARALQSVKIPMTSSCSSFAFLLICSSLSTPPLF